MPPAAAFALLVGIACAAIMGFAINRGATCMVAAVEQAVRQRRANRIVALAEASVWVAGGMVLASIVGLMPKPVLQHPISAMTIVGGALLGLGAYVNKACVFGSVARFGSGEWHYVATPLGFLAGCVLVLPLLKTQMPVAAMQGPPHFSLIFGAALILFGLWRGIGLLRAARQGVLSAHIWAPHQATSVIGLAFVIMLLTVGAWTYPEALAELARGMTMDSAARFALFAALLAGAAWGGAARRREDGGKWSIRGAVSCFAGGALMGMGSVMIPGGNDNLILVGLPFLRPYAWVAIAAMGGMITVCVLIEDVTKRTLDSAISKH